jgi:hypothetical protein
MVGMRSNGYTSGKIKRKEIAAKNIETFNVFINSCLFMKKDHRKRKPMMHSVNKVM